jgi:hypothetical protein
MSRRMFLQSNLEKQKWVPFCKCKYIINSNACLMSPIILMLASDTDYGEDWPKPAKTWSLLLLVCVCFRKILVKCCVHLLEQFHLDTQGHLIGMGSDVTSCFAEVRVSLHPEPVQVKMPALWVETKQPRGWELRACAHTDPIWIWPDLCRYLFPAQGFCFFR